MAKRPLLRWAGGWVGGRVFESRQKASWRAQVGGLAQTFQNIPCKCQLDGILGNGEGGSVGGGVSAPEQMG